MATWTTPKTDWVATDYFNWSDFNRIKNNLAYLHDEAEKVCPPFSVNSTSTSNITSYSYIWNPSDINKLEQDLTAIFNAVKYSDMGIGTQKSFTYNGAFIDYKELNRIESASLEIYRRLENQVDGRTHIAVTLGFKLGGVQF